MMGSKCRGYSSESGELTIYPHHTKVNGKVFSVHAMKAYEGEEIKLQPFLTSALDRD